MDSVQSMLCCTNKIITCFIINKHTNTDTDTGEKEKVIDFQREKPFTGTILVVLLNQQYKRCGKVY